MGNYKIFLGILASAIALVSYTIYFFKVLKGKIKPHAFSWFIWGITTGIIFTAQIIKHGGAGAWMTGITSLSCFIICGAALVKGKRDFVVWDWFFLFVTLISLILWQLTKQLTPSVILITLTDALGILPTLRKGYQKPHEESVTQFFLGSIKAFISIAALQSYSLVTWLYPGMLAIVNPLVTVTLMLRRRKINH